MEARNSGTDVKPVVASPPLVRVGAGRPNLDARRRPERRNRTDRERQLAREEEAAVVARQGLRGDYYDFLDGQLRNIPDLATIPPTFTRIDLTVDFSRDEEFRLPFYPETFAALWRGFLTAPEAGKYVFTIGSDDGVRLKVGEEVVLEHASLRAHAESHGEIQLTAGRHPIEIVFFENLTFALCRLYWDGPSFERRIVPSSALAPPQDVADVLRPHVTSVEPSSARVGDEVVLTGLGFSSEALFDHVTFNGVPAEVLEATAETLRVVVPLGAEAGDVLVQVGPLSSLPRRFEIENLQGLYAEYFLIGSNLTQHPDLTEHTPYFVRLDGPLDYHQDGLWNLPYEPDVFAARMTGYLYVPADDTYTITLGSDDGTRVELDGETFIDDPGLHSYRERQGDAQLTKGFHPIAIHFFENRGVARLRLFWQRPGDLQRQVIPRGFLFPPEDVAGRPAPRLAKKRLSGEVGETITIKGIALGGEIGLVRVRFPGDVWVRPQRVDGNSLTVKVPDGADTGKLRVDVGVLSSNAVRFERTTPMGFTAKYYVFSNETELIANATPDALTNRAINLTRVETSLDRTKKTHWNLPFPHRNTALHLRARINMPVARRIGFLIQAEGGFLMRVDGRDRRSQPPLRPQHEESAWIDFAPGEHVIDIYHFHGQGSAVLRVFWTPAGLDDHRDIPARWWRPD